MADRRWVLQLDMRPRALPSARAKPGQKGYRPRPYQEWAKQAVKNLRGIWAGKPPIEGPVTVNLALSPRRITVWIDPLEGDSERDGLQGDVDNYGKAVLDCLKQAGVIGDDKQVESLRVGFVRADEEG